MPAVALARMHLPARRLAPTRLRGARGIVPLLISTDVLVTFAEREVLDHFLPVIRLPSEIAESRARFRRWGLSTAAAVLLLASVGAGAYFLLIAGDGETISAVTSAQDAGDV